MEFYPFHLGWISLASQLSVIPPHPSPLIFSSLPHLFWHINGSFPSWDRERKGEQPNAGEIRLDIISLMVCILKQDYVGMNLQHQGSIWL